MVFGKYHKTELMHLTILNWGGHDPHFLSHCFFLFSLWLEVICTTGILTFKAF